MSVWRCEVTLVELTHEPRFNLSLVLKGEGGLDSSPRWMAHAAHLPEPRPVTLQQLGVIEQLPASTPLDRAALSAQHGEAMVQSLLDAGLLLDAAAGHRAMACNLAAKEVPWWPLALVAQASGGWDGIDIQARYEAGLMPSSRQVVEANGPAPDHEYLRRPDAPILSLPAPTARDFDALLARRRTCRNFDAAAAVPAADLATMLHRVWGAIGTRQLAPGAVAVKKTSPAGGGLHAVEAYLLVQRAEGLEPGIYHYLPLRHALERLQALSPVEARAEAYRFVAGQQWFVDVPVMVVMTARFDRLFWKYRRHAKAWRVVHLDVGHLSQTMYLSAADLGLGAFVTAAINDREIEASLGLAPLREGAIAIVGFGPRSDKSANVELDGLTPTQAARQALGL